MEALSGPFRIEFREAMSRRNIPAEVFSLPTEGAGACCTPVGLLYPHKGVVLVAHDRIRRLFL